MSGEDFERSNITRLDNFNAYVPGLSVTKNDGAGRVVSIRGVGWETAQNLSTQPSVLLYMDGIYIASDARHVDNAYRFLDFILRADVAADIAIQVDYANANAASWEHLSEDVLNNPAIYPDDEIWDRMFAVDIAEPAVDRLRTRTLSRAKSGL